MIDRPDFEDPLGRTMFEQLYADGSIEVSPAPGQWVCDFCLTPNPTWSYPCGLVKVHGHPTMDASDDDWAACDRCHEFIEAGGDLGPFVEHIVDSQRRQTLAPAFARPARSTQVRNVVASLREFLAGRQGPAERLP